jgi:phospho-N-acetylmuramoyl-pentapeptide-transferase
MLYHLLYPLHGSMKVFNVFRYITFRTAMAILTALVVSLILGPWLIRRLRHFQIGQEIREDGPATHHAKKGTPTMGGLLVLTAVVPTTLLWADLRNPFVWIAIVAMCAFGAIGFWDDYVKMVKKRSLGLTARGKFGLQIVLSLAIGTLLYAMSYQGLFSTQLVFPFVKTFAPMLGMLFPLFVALVLTGASNAVNLTDGLDGLAIGSFLVASTTFMILAYAAGNAIVADYLDIANVKQAGELTIFCGALVGASLGFLWYNGHPAEVFMGDVGSMALGGALGTIAILIKQEFMLVIVGGLFVVEALSVIVQVASFKSRGKRVFRMAPLHHHFELSGWSEMKVVIRFWIVAIIFALLGLATLKLR